MPSKTRSISCSCLALCLGWYSEAPSEYNTSASLRKVRETAHSPATNTPNPPTFWSLDNPDLELACKDNELIQMHELEFPWRRLTIYKCMQCQILASLCSFHILCPSCILTNEPLIILPWAAQVFLLGLGFLFVFIPFHISRVAINIQAEVWIGEPSQDHKVPLPSIWSMLCTWVSCNICSTVYKLKRKTSKIPTTLILRN